MEVLSDVFGLLLGVAAPARHAFRRAVESGDREASSDLAQRTLLYGAGWAGVIVARSAQRDPAAGIVPVGFLDDDRGLKGSRAAGLRIFGDVNEMATARHRTGASSVLVVLPHSSGAQVRRVVDAAIRQGLSVRTIPAMTDLLDGTAQASHARRLRIEDLQRGPFTAPSTALQELVEDSAVMITGAGGRVGSQLARRLLSLKPSRIVLVDEAERGLRVVSDQLAQTQRVAQGMTSVTGHRLDPMDRKALSELIVQAGPRTIFHAGAISDGSAPARSAVDRVRLNIDGTRALVGAAVDALVQRFVLVSSDEPSSRSDLIGSSMRLAEVIVSDAGRRADRGFATVRMASLAGPRPHAIDTFRSQPGDGEPLIVDASRPWRHPMALAEASGIILEAAALAEPGSVYRLDPGAPVRVGDIARDELRLLGHDVDRVLLKIVGKPPEDQQQRQRRDAPTSVRGLLRIETTRTAPVTFAADVDQLASLARSNDADQLLAALKRYVDYLDSTNVRFVDEHGHRPVVAVPVAVTAKVPGPRVTASRRSRGRPSVVAGSTQGRRAR